MPGAVEEIIRWVTPVKAFMRTAAESTSVRGVPIAAGDSLLLSYVSANRDEDVFEDPSRFDVGREPNKHVAFGFGVHFCLGAGLARMEIAKFFTELLPRLRSIELTGKPELHRDDVRGRAQAPPGSLLTDLTRIHARGTHMTNAQAWDETLQDLKARRAHALAMGGPERVAKHRGKGKLDARARIEHLLDPGSFQEFGTLVGGQVAADAIVAGSGLIGCGSAGVSGFACAGLVVAGLPAWCGCECGCGRVASTF